MAFHPGDLKRGTLHGIIKQAGLTIDEFIDLL
ncbi:MAG: type II toxin-antitoxin system HicA family toxin [Burkholderiales bacterium]